MYSYSVKHFILIRFSFISDVVVYTCFVAYFCLCQNNNKGMYLQCNYTFWGSDKVQWIEVALPQTNSGAAVYVTWHDMSWYDVTCDMMWWDMWWCSVAWHDMMWCDMAWHDMVWHGMAWHGMISHNMMWHVIVWYDMAWHDLMWNDVT